MSRDMTINGLFRTAPEWCADFRSPDHLIPGGSLLDPTQFMAPDGTKVKLTANAAQGAVSLTVTALTNTLPSGTMLHFAAGKFALTTDDSAAGDTTVAVEALPVALANGDSATYLGKLKKSIPSGTFIGRTYAERDAGTAFGPADPNDDQVYLVPFEVSDADRISDVELLRPGTVVKENFLPGIETYSAQLLAKLRSTYHCITGYDYADLVI